MPSKSPLNQTSLGPAKIALMTSPTYRPPEFRQFSWDELDEEEDEAGAVEDVQDSDQDMFGTSGDDGGDAVPHLNDILLSVLCTFAL